MRERADRKQPVRSVERLERISCFLPGRYLPKIVTGSAEMFSSSNTRTVLFTHILAGAVGTAGTHCVFVNGHPVSTSPLLPVLEGIVIPRRPASRAARAVGIDIPVALAVGGSCSEQRRRH